MDGLTDARRAQQRAPGEVADVDAEAQRRHVAELLEREQGALTYGVIELHLQAGRLVRTKVSRTDEYPPKTGR